jgi:transmembrane sensor
MGDDMAVTNEPDRREAALDWLVRTNDPEFDAWDEFTAWLEHDSANADAYHELARSEAEIRPVVATMPSPKPQSFRPQRRQLAVVSGIAAIAAALAVVVVPRAMPVDYETAPGEIRVVALGGQDQLVMNGATKLQLAGFDRRTVRLAQGQVLLRLRDSSQDKIEVLAGDLQLVDIGTIFEVSRDGRETRVAVSEGMVVADPDGANLRLAAGQRLETRDGDAVLQAMSADPSSVGSFERGQLVYLDEPLDNVIADLRRSTGIDFSASGAMRARRFSGTLSVAEVRRDPRSLEPLLGVSVERSGQGWKLGGRV